jgi:hypothetical protein
VDDGIDVGLKVWQDEACTESQLKLKPSNSANARGFSGCELRSQTDMLKPTGFMQGRQTAALVGAIVVIMCCLSLDPVRVC